MIIWMMQFNTGGAISAMALALDADPATLDAVVAFLDELDAPSALSPPSAADIRVLTASPPSGVQRRPQSKRRSSATNAVYHNRSRDREKRELLFLRGEVERLEETLSALAVPRAVPTQSRGEHESLRARGARLELLSVWRRIAERQQRLRIAAEEENASLKSHVAEQQRVAKILERTIRREMAKTYVRDDALC